METRARKPMPAGRTIGGMSIEELRRATRSELLDAQADRPVIVTGHQPAFVHPGVWAKHVVVRQAIDRWSVAGLDLVVDNDAPRSFALALPAVTPEGSVEVASVDLVDAAVGTTYEGSPPIKPERINRLREQVHQAMADPWCQTLMFDYLDGLEASTTAADFVDQHMSARGRVDRSLGADLPEHRVSNTFHGPFVAELLVHAESFATAYNAALADYRREHHVRSPDRPLPDLGREGDRIETALWAYQPRQRRRRLWIEQTGDRLNCYAGGDSIGTLGVKDLLADADRTLAQLAPWRIRPRALTLTLWARLLVGDLFVHGIGGAKYDRITDRLFRDWLDLDPPPYVCVSATLHLPLPTHPVAPSDLSATRHRRRDLQFNPQRYLQDPPTRLLEQREHLIAQSEEQRQRQAPRRERHHTFQAIRDINARLLDTAPGLTDQVDEQLNRLTAQLGSNERARGREYFYALEPPDRLARLADKLRKAFD